MHTVFIHSTERKWMHTSQGLGGRFHEISFKKQAPRKFQYFEIKTYCFINAKRLFLAIH